MRSQEKHRKQTKSVTVHQRHNTGCDCVSIDVLQGSSTSQILQGKPLSQPAPQTHTNKKRKKERKSML